jgi:hypothetical protein
MHQKIRIVMPKFERVEKNMGAKLKLGLTARGALALAVVGTLALAAVPAPAAASSTFGWSLSCSGLGSSGWCVVQWVWTDDAEPIASDALVIEGFYQGPEPVQVSESGLDRPSGANGINVTVTIYDVCGSPEKVVSKDFKVDGRFKVQLGVTTKGGQAGQWCNSLYGIQSLSFSMAG